MDIKIIEKYRTRWKEIPLTDDMKFRIISKSKEAMQEILRTILKDEGIVVIETIEQRSRKAAYFHGVILDCECRLSTGEIVNVEVQIANEDNAIYRMRYNQSVLTVENSLQDKNFRYKNLQKIISIMFCEFDIFDNGEPIYEIKRKVNESEIIADNGIKEMYINLKATAKEEKLKQLFKIFTVAEYKNKKMFPELSKKKEEVIGGKSMSGIALEIYNDAMTEGIAQGRAEGQAQGREAASNELLDRLVNEGLITRDEADRQLALMK